MAVQVDYYAVLGVARGATSDEIQAAVKKSMREWRKRTEAADLSVRQEAEIKVKHIEEARTLLLDEARRKSYDADLAGGVERSEVPMASGNGDWLERALGFLSVGDYNSAAYAAAEATRVGTNDAAKCWWVRSRADAGLNKWSEALFEATEAVRLEESNPEYHFNLGCVAEEMKRWDQALQEFTRASNLDPSSPMYQLAVGGVYLQNGHADRALTVIEAVQRQHPTDENANTYLGMALIEVAEQVPRQRNRDSYMITSAEEIKRMRPLALRAKELQHAGREVRDEAVRVLDYLDRMEKMTFRMPPFLVGAAAAGFDGGLGAGCLGIVLVGIIMMLPLILVFSGFGMLGDGNAGGLLMLLIGGGLGYLWWRYTYVPTWKKNL